MHFNVREELLLYELFKKGCFLTFERCVPSIFSIELVAHFYIVLEEVVAVAID
jgi:hypothetical protein